MTNEMDDILKEVGDEVTGKRSIHLHIKDPNVPCLDLIDMPGLVTSAPNDEKTRKLITDFIQVGASCVLVITDPLLCSHHGS